MLRGWEWTKCGQASGLGLNVPNCIPRCVLDCFTTVGKAAVKEGQRLRILGPSLRNRLDRGLADLPAGVADGELVQKAQGLP